MNAHRPTQSFHPVALALRESFTPLRSLFVVDQGYRYHEEE